LCSKYNLLRCEEIDGSQTVSSQKKTAHHSHPQYDGFCAAGAMQTLFIA